MAASRSTLAYRVARRIAARRVERGLSQEGLAVLLDIAVKNVQRIESGRQNLSLATIERIASALTIAPEQLIAGSTRSSEPASKTEQSPLGRLEQAGFLVRRATVRGRRSATATPVTTLRAAAGQLTGAARAIEVLGWVVIPRRGEPPEGQFVAQVLGTSMEPAIPSGAFCLFGPPGPLPLIGRTLLVAHETLSDPDLGGPYALKRVRSVRRRRGGGVRVILESINPAFAPIEIDAAEGELRIVAELVKVLV
ncbi:MAG: helix-turn-helix domain-containing protein [Myxococcales bacterium]|nr:helix-turn-helix domain-containing protein [Myxococcales bacterium]